MPQRGREARRFLATVLFTDIVGSTERAEALGDRGWRDLLELHNAVVRRELKAFGGQEMDTAGDGFFAVFETPERAVRAAESITRAVQTLGIAVRAGVHTGECEMVAGKVGGITVNIGARIAALAEPGEVLVSGSVRDLMTGSGVRFDGGEPQTLKGVENTWRVYRLVPDAIDGEPPQTRRSLVPLYTRRKRRHVVMAVVAVVGLLVIVVPLLVLRAEPSPAVVVGENSVGIVENGDTRATAAVHVGERPTGVAVGLGAVWVTNSTADTVSRIDPETLTVATIAVRPGPAGVAVGAGAVWVANSGDGTVSRIDPRANRVTQIPVLPGPTGVVVAAGSVWVTNTLGASVTQIDPRTSKVVHEVPVGAGPSGIAYGAGSLWVANQSDGTVTRLDPATRRKDPPIKVGSGPVGVAFTDGAVWVTNNLNGSLSRIDVDDYAVTAIKIDADGGTYGVAGSGRTVWVSNSYTGTLSQVHTRRFAVVTTIRTGGSPLGLALAKNRLWFASADAGTALHRGGVLRFAARGLAHFVTDPTVIDPAGALDPALGRLLAMTNDGLVAFRRTGGVEGAQPVPDLATALPVVTDDGLTYTFHLRPGIHYSTGDLVQPGDIRRGIERTFRNDDGPYRYYEAIKGASRCGPKAPPCDLSAGILVDTSSRTITFRLSRREPDFLRLLALPAAYATPAGTPTPLPDGDQVPATGPYMVKSYDPAPTNKKGDAIGTGRLELVRNPHFRQWSAAAQPYGYPDRIVIDIGLTHGQVLRQVSEGRADAAWTGVPPEREPDLRARFPDQVHTVPGDFVFYVFLNTTVPPFDNRDARRAVGYAMNRRAMASDGGFFSDGQVTCQVLPPNFPGFDPYCPYTVPGGPPGEWTAPDLLKARQLVRASGTKGASVGVLTLPDTRAEDQHLVNMLTSLGYHAALRQPEDDHPFPLKPKYHVQAGLFGYGADFPGQANYMPPIVTCAGRGSAGWNLSSFCDPDIDKLFAQVKERQITDPAGAPALWAKIDKAVVDEAPILPYSYEIRYEFLSARVGNFQHHPLYGLMPAQMWVQ